ATLPGLVRRSRLPVAVAAATSTVVVAGTVTGAAATHLVELAREGGLSAIPWHLLVWAVPGAVIGAFIGTRLQGRVSEDAARRFFSGLFLTIGITFLVAFTVFKARFA
ncbi:MAG: sulfite exporter TauE/SafE family protein, partial [Actinomycetota bacterium]|nr:sulfite exporter TauE/SafE family protein [Actinomycetota bacterium]